MLTFNDALLLVWICGMISLPLWVISLWLRVIYEVIKGRIDGIDQRLDDRRSEDNR